MPTRPRIMPAGRLTVVALSALGIAACQDAVGPDDPGGPDVQPPGWTEPVQLGGQNGRIAAGDLLHFVGPVAGSSGLSHRRSDDSGVTWSSPQTIPGAGQPPLYRAFAADGRRLFLLTTESDGHLYLRTSPDAGSTWRSPVRISNAQVERPHRVAIAVLGPVVHVTNSREFNAGANRQVFYWRSADGGASFGPVTVLDRHPDGPVNPSVASAGNSVHVLYERWSEGQIYYLRSSDGGLTWGTPVRVSEPSIGKAYRPRIAAVDGRVIATWQQDLAGPPFTQRIGVRRSMDGGSTWQPNQFATPAGRLFNHQVLLALPGGPVHIVSLDGDPNAPGTTAQYARSLDYGATWSAPETVASQDRDGASQPFEITVHGQYLHMILGPERALYTRRGIAR